MVITPAHMQLHVDVLFSAGWPPTINVGDPGAHGDCVIGIHGCGVNTP